MNSWALPESSGPARALRWRLDGVALEDMTREASWATRRPVLRPAGVVGHGVGLRLTGERDVDELVEADPVTEGR